MDVPNKLQTRLAYRKPYLFNTSPAINITEFLADTADATPQTGYVEVGGGIGRLDTVLMHALPRGTCTSQPRAVPTRFRPFSRR